MMQPSRTPSVTGRGCRLDASMDALMIERSLDFILFPVTAVMRRN